MNSLLKTGVKVIGTNVDFVDTIMSFNSIRMVKYKCQWHDEKTNLIYIFYSESFPETQLGKTMPESLDVYIDPNNPKKYWVSL